MIETDQMPPASCAGGRTPPGFAGVEVIFRMFRTGFPDVKLTRGGPCRRPFTATPV